MSFPDPRLLYHNLSASKQVVLAGDGRADSPGHSAKYGSYSLLDLKCSKIVDFKLVQLRQSLISKSGLLMLTN